MITLEAKRAEFTYTPKPGFLYVRSRAISSRTNDNYDTYPAEELREAYRTFIGKPVFVNHNNDVITRARGIVTDAVLHEHIAPDGTPDTWIEVLHEVDARRFPRLARAILDGDIDRTSMGCNVQSSECSYCGKVASAPQDYCEHINNQKGRRLSRRSPDGGTEVVLVHEICRGLGFFENSLLVDEPADPTAFFLGVDDSAVRSEAQLYTAIMREGALHVAGEHPLAGDLSALSEDNQALVLSELRRIPADVVGMLASKGVKVLGVAKATKTEKSRLDYGGFYDTAVRTVVLSNRGLDENGNNGSQIVLHEMGHALDHALGMPSKSKEFRSIWKDAEPRKGGYFQHTFGGSDPRGEMFAEACACVWGGYTNDDFTLTEYLRQVVNELRHNINTGLPVDSTGFEYEAHKVAAFIPPGDPMTTHEAAAGRVRMYRNDEQSETLCPRCAKFYPKVKTDPAWKVVRSGDEGTGAEDIAVCSECGKTIVALKVEGKLNADGEREADEKACDHFEADPDDAGVCATCEWAIGAHDTKAGGPDGRGGFGPYKKKAYDEPHRPHPIETLRNQTCPVCTSQNTWDGNICTVCGYVLPPRPFQAPDTDVTNRVTPEEGWFDPDAKKAPPFEPKAEAADDQPGGKPKTDPVPKASSATKGQRAQGELTMAQNPSIAAAARQRYQERVAAGRRTAAEADTSTTPIVPNEPGAKAVPNTTEQTLAIPETVDVEAEGAVTEVPTADTTGVDVQAQGEVVADSAIPSTDVESPVKGGNEIDPDADHTTADPDTRAETKDFSKDTAGDWVNSSRLNPKVVEAHIARRVEAALTAQRDRIFGSLSLARLRTQAGIAEGNDLELAREIEASPMTTEALVAETTSLRKVVAANRTAQRQAPAQRQASRRAPSLAGQMPTLQHHAGADDGADDPFLFS